MISETDRVERVKWQMRLQTETHAGTPRAIRAERFANCIQSVLREFLPTDRECQRAIHRFLLETAFIGNITVIDVPPEYDAFDKLRIEQAMLDRVKQPIIMEKK